jgi:hypothetical protein
VTVAHNLADYLQEFQEYNVYNNYSVKLEPQDGSVAVASNALFEAQNNVTILASDGFVADLSGVIADVQRLNGFLDMSEMIKSNLTPGFEWTEILPFYRKHIAVCLLFHTTFCGLLGFMDLLHFWH